MQPGIITCVQKKVKVAAKENRIFKYWFPVIGWAIVIFWFSSRSVNPTSQIYFWDFIFKKSAHIVVYFILSLLFYRALVNFGFDKKKSGIAAIVFCLLYGLSDEIHQSFTPGRGPALRDVLIDTFGATLGVILIWKYLPKAPKRLKLWAEKLQIS